MYGDGDIEILKPCFLLHWMLDCGQHEYIVFQPVDRISLLMFGSFLFFFYFLVWSMIEVDCVILKHSGSSKVSPSHTNERE